jgi:hypothetical protein
LHHLLLSPYYNTCIEIRDKDCHHVPIQHLAVCLTLSTTVLQKLTTKTYESHKLNLCK